MILRQQLEQDLIAAMKSRDSQKRSVLRYLLSAIKYKEVDTKAPLTDEQVIEVLAKQVKTHKESVVAFRAGGRAELAQKEESEIKILQSYLPSQISEDEVKKAVAGVLSQLPGEGKETDFATLMKASMAILKGRVDGSLVKKIVEEVLKEG